MNNNTDMKSASSGKKKNGFISFLGQRKFRFGGLAIVMTAVIIAVVILLNVALGAIEKSRALTIDVSALNATDFDQTTYDVVNMVEDDVYVYAVYQASTSNSLRVQVDSVLEKYHALNGKIHVGTIDPVAEPTRVAKFSSDTSSLTEGAVIVTNADESRVKVINRSEYYGQSSYGQMNWTYFRLESYVTTALIYVTSTESPNVYFLTGHGELEREKAFTAVTTALQNHNYDVSTLDLINSETELQAGDTVIIVDPQRDLTDDEYETMRTWLASGGRMLVSLSYNVDVTPLKNFTRLLDYYHLAYADGVIAENENSTSNYWNGSTTNLIPNLDAEHEITADLATAGNTLVVPVARPIANVDLPESGTVYTKLLTTSNRAVVMDAGGATSDPGTQTLALAMLDADANDKNKDVRIVMLGSYYLMVDSNYLYYSYNLDFVVNAVDWLVNSESTVEVSSKYLSSSDTALAIPDTTTAIVIGVIVIAVIPLVILVGGLIVWNKRRRL